MALQTVELGAAPARPVRHIGHALLNLLVVAVALAAVAIGALIRIDHLQLEPVLSGSMRPAAQPGDLVVAKQTSTHALHVGEVVAFYPPGTTGAPVMHRIVTLTRDGNATTIITKGDANGTVDQWGPIRLASASTYRLVGVVPKVGFVSVWVHRLAGRSGRGLLLILAGGLVLTVGANSLRQTRSATDDHIRGRQLRGEVEQ